MNKPVRFLIVFIVFLVMIIFSHGNDLPGAVAGKAIHAFGAEPIAVTGPGNSTLRQKLVLLEFFSGL